MASGYVALLRQFDEANWRGNHAVAPLSGAWLRLCEAEERRPLGDPSPEAWTDAAVAFAGLAMPYQVAYARWRQAEAQLAGRGPRDRAAGALLDAHRTATELGAEPLRAEIEAIARRARIDLEGQRQPADLASKPEVPFGLTTRELEVLELLVAGLTNREIAADLFVAPKTVSAHVEHILNKLGVSRRMEAAAIAHRLGLVAARTPPPGP
jgi:DNA-binding CsgD family transcriptional regulator